MPSDTSISYGILTVSDRCFAGDATDRSGPALKEYVENPHLNKACGYVEIQKCVPDDKIKIANVLAEWSDDLKLNVVLTTGGTGFSPRDVTPEATKSVLHKMAPGLMTAMLNTGLLKTPYAMLSRSVCGVRNQTLILNLPGSTSGAVESLQAVSGVITHAVELIIDNKEAINQTHLHALEGKSSKVDTSKIAERDRESPYPLLPVHEAQQIVLSASTCNPVLLIDVGLEALGMILAEDVVAKDPLPPFRASVKDGYAAVACDGPGIRRVIGQSNAGYQVNTTVLTCGEAIRVNTGAPVPLGADCVVQIEDTRLVKSSPDGKTELEVEILISPEFGQDIRPVGCDIEIGQKVLEHGTKIGPSELGLLAAVGATSLLVVSLPKIAVLSTGDELQQPNTPLQSGKIRDSNKIMLLSLLHERGFPAKDAGIAEDSPDILLTQLTYALDTADVIITTGSVSMGDRDILRKVLIEDLLATVHFARVNMKPGKPTTFATLHYKGKPKIVFGLPGNPVSSYVTCNLFVLPALRKISGYPSVNGVTVTAVIEEDISLDPRPEYHRASLNWSEGKPLPIAQSTGSQMSSRLISCASANALVILPPRTDECKILPAGTEVQALILGDLC